MYARNQKFVCFDVWACEMAEDVEVEASVTMMSWTPEACRAEGTGTASVGEGCGAGGIGTASVGEGCGAGGIGTAFVGEACE